MKRKQSKGAKSITMKGRMDYTTKRGDKDFHRKGKDVVRARQPYRRKLNRQRRIKAGGKVRGRTAKPLMTPATRSVAPPNIYMGGNRASYLAPPANAVRPKRGGRKRSSY